MFQVGDRVGDYQVTGVLGRGGMGRVYRVRSLLTDREEAMKVVLDDDPSLADRFLREIRVHASLQHPNIAALHTAMRIDDRVIMILELVDGVTLEETMRNALLPIATSIYYLEQALSALAYAHDRGVVHRDIKPANILVAAGGVVKLTDFGIARKEGVHRLTGTGMALGTLNYMSPEQVRGGEADARSDIYSLGLTAYEMVTGRRAIGGDTAPAIMNAQLGYVPPPAVSVNPAAPRVLSEAIACAIAKEPEQRFQTARDFLAALRDPARAGGPAPAATVLMSSFSAPASASPPPPANAPELAEMEARLSRVIGPIARRLVADAARRYTTLPEIRQALAAQIEDPAERDAFCRTPASTPKPPQAAAPVSWQPAVLERLSQALAAHIGPIARVVVTRAARTAPDAEALLAALASEIPTPADRQKFVASARPLLS